MRGKSLIILFMGILLSLSGCSKDNNEKMNQGNTINYEAKVESKENLPTSVDLSEFNITKSEDEISGVMFMPRDTRDSWELRFEKFRGTHTMSKLKLDKEQSVKLQYSSKIESGKLVFLILDKGGNILKFVEGSKEEIVELTAPEVGEYTLKVVGDEATGGEVVVKFK
ncbi:hypothetical protein J2Z44_002754 [Clostridium punense]|uniref:Lipoprotein n=1 Tax=Clostridium punense TaxID=1054297 RepID=A0ABS4K574_9CLOT|nr:MULTISPECIES: hypothetical protein [Clostridium]EQB85862.1 hypothetical protein M918_17090 [Clostridium sp. BL8]MBP2022929.1 hypothetical protein [Clostridium punense]